VDAIKLKQTGRGWYRSVPAGRPLIIGPYSSIIKAASLDLMNIMIPEINRISLLISFLVSLFILANFIACEKKSPVKGLVVNPEFSEKTLTDDLVTKLRIKFITTSSFELLQKDYRIVAEADWQGRFLFQESLQLKTPTTKWLANRVYEVNKYVYLPAFINRFDPEMAGGARINLSISFQSEGQVAPIILFQKSLKISPRPLEVSEVVYLDGWQKIIRAWPAAERPLIDLWTQGQAVCLLKNPGKAALLMIRGEALAGAGASQKVLLFLDNLQLDEFELSRGRFEKIYSLTEKDLGQKPELTLTIAVNKTIRASELYPEIKDERELGLKIKTIYFR
jgi:hypothetical protein